ncbi:lipopolysaccharide assembly protein LapA domain-containing protein [Candidatus Magnetominusculus xianensis]|uniref:Magnetosome protein Man2 n=1 Tax=Candidatus Magnetominusculus xianensis TaxID=1748249 RepID=A0ABR5SKM2_9BACT|nr:LapA family protein [Candidatus Magnetominusculus xianensis]KWT94827.1 magnetosome protein Man2 [Candidatus Magnetominusculus xianensis]MBF0404719.1 LapA family protein [Nitrospirota bacterium]
MDKILTKKLVIPLITVLFLGAVFIDQNAVPVPMKFFIGSPIHMHLSAIIVVSMAAGSALTIVGFLIFKGIQQKIKKRKMEQEIRDF